MYDGKEGGRPEVSLAPPGSSRLLQAPPRAEQALSPCTNQPGHLQLKAGKRGEKGRRERGGGGEEEMGRSSTGGSVGINTKEGHGLQGTLPGQKPRGSAPQAPPLPHCTRETLAQTGDKAGL